jgi:gas vesicle protein
MVRAGLVNIASQEEIVRKVAEVANSAKKSKTATVINSVSDEEVVDSNSNENEPTEEEVNSESEPGND